MKIYVPLLWGKKLY